MKSTTLIFILASAIIFYGSCNTNTTTTPTPVAGISGYFISEKGYIPVQLGGTGDSTWGENGYAFFSSTPGDTVLVLADSVYLNGYPTEEDSLYYFSMVPGGTGQMLQMNNSATWQVWGTNGVPSFTYNFTSPYPTLPLDPALPDTIDHNAGFTMPLPTSADSVTITVAGNAGQALKHLSGSATTVSFSASELAGIGVAQEGLIQIDAGKYTTQTFSGKDYLFIKTAQKIKIVWLK